MVPTCDCAAPTDVESGSLILSSVLRPIKEAGDTAIGLKGISQASNPMMTLATAAMTAMDSLFIGQTPSVMAGILAPEGLVMEVHRRHSICSA